METKSIENCVLLGISIRILHRALPPPTHGIQALHARCILLQHAVAFLALTCSHSAAAVVLAALSIVCSFKSLMTMYRLRTIQPYRNHRI